MELIVLGLSEAEASSFSDRLNFKPLSLPRRKYVYKNNEIVFITFGGRGDEPKERGFPPDFYGLFIEEQDVLFSAYSSNSLQTDGNQRINLEITLLSEIHAELIEEIKELIIEIMNCYYFSRGYVKFSLGFVFS